MNRKLKSALALIAVTAMSVTTFAACGSSSSSDSSKGKVYYLNFKPEAADEWADLAAEYTKGNRCRGQRSDRGLQYL